MKNYLILILTLSCLLFGQTAGRIKGVVKDDVGDPLPGAYVTVDGTPLGAQTDENGYYYIIGVRAGTYNLQSRKL